MYQGDLWKYCTPGHCRDMLLSFRLLGDTDWPDERVISCLYAVSNHAERHYHETSVPKKNGDRRKLLVPDPLLKRIQRNILHHVLDGMEVSPSASAYRRGVSLLDNVSVHTGKPLILKLDIRDFFGSIIFPEVRQNAFPETLFPVSVGTMLAALCCYQDVLPQGAPTSPALSNLVMKPFDRYMEQWCGEREISYTRYCDDMTFSGAFNAALVHRKVKGFLESMGMELNEEKNRVISPGHRQTVTGIVVNEKPQVPADYRRRLRQEVYYCTKFGVKSHLERMKGQGADYAWEDGERYLMSLSGRIQFVLQVNPKDAWFQKAGEEIKELFQKASEDF